MITHVIVELKKPVKEEFFHMDTVLPSEYYGYGTPLIRCKDCKHWQYESCFVESEEGDADSIILDRFAFDFCSRAERRNDETD